MSWSSFLRWYYVVSKWDIRGDTDDLGPIADVSLIPLLYFSAAELDFALSFSLLVSLLSLSLNSLDLFFPPQYRDSLWLDFILGSCLVVYTMLDLSRHCRECSPLQPCFPTLLRGVKWHPIFRGIPTVINEDHVSGFSYHVLQ